MYYSLWLIDYFELISQYSFSKIKLSLDIVIGIVIWYESLLLVEDKVPKTNLFSKILTKSLFESVYFKKIEFHLDHQVNNH